MRDLPVNVLAEALAYNPISGVLSWKSRPRHHFRSHHAWVMFNPKYAGKPAGSVTKTGYLAFEISVRGDIFRPKAHRVAWALHHGTWPEHHIDHINGDRRDNRISNLRDVPNCENARNQRLHLTNTSGHAGVTFHKKSGKWLAQITYQGQHHYLGVFHNLEDAVIARKAAADAFGFHPNHGRNHAQ